MSHRLAFLGVGGLLFLTGCPPAPPPGPAPAPQPGPAETYTHAPSQFRFPPNAGPFAREAVRLYDREGRDVSVGYNNVARAVAVTVYVYPVPPGAAGGLEGHFKVCQREVLARHPGAEPASEAPVTVSPGGRERAGWRAAFTYTGPLAHRRQAVRSELYLFADGPWFIKYRVTYPADRQAAAEPDVRAFLEGLDWPEGAKG